MNKQLNIGIDLGGTNAIMGVVYENEIILTYSFPTSNFPTGDSFVTFISDQINSVLDSNSTFILCGIGIGAPCGNPFTGCIDNAINLPWGNFNIVSKFKSFFNIPVSVNNDANAATIGEKIYGNAKDMKDFVVITLGTGIGSGIFSNNKIVYGCDGNAAEIGHMIVEPEGRKCACGRSGCLETYASASGILRTLKNILENSNLDSELRSQSIDKITPKDIYLAAMNNDKIALEIFDFTAKYLGLGLSNVAAFTSPEAIILFGGISNADDILLKPLDYYFKKYLLFLYKDIKIIKSGLKGADSAILGAAALTQV